MLQQSLTVNCTSAFVSFLGKNAKIDDAIFMSPFKESPFGESYHVVFGILLQYDVLCQAKLLKPVFSGGGGGGDS